MTDGWVLPLDLDETDLRVPGFAFAGDEFGFPTFSNEGIESELLSFEEFGLEEDETIDRLRVRSTSLPDWLRFSTSEADVGISVVGLVVLKEKMKKSEEERRESATMYAKRKVKEEDAFEREAKRDSIRKLNATTHVELRNNALPFGDDPTILPVRVDGFGHSA